MKKSDKKLDNKLRNALMVVCEQALNENAGFKWLTHIVNFNRFPQSLIVVCVFDTNADLDKAKSNNLTAELVKLISCEFVKAEFNIKELTQHVKFDTEENCDNQNYGRWNQRLSGFVVH